MRSALALALLTMTAASGCREAPEPETATATASASVSIPFRIDGTLSFVRDGDTLRTIDVEVADTDSSRQRGLMERETIPPDTGMLFVFDRPDTGGFWMMNTPHPLDIQFYGPDSTLLNVAENTTPFSTETLPPAGPAQFVVEVPAGYTRRLGLVPGDRITWSLDRPTRASPQGPAGEAPSAP
jgi:uncharacterized membrane protein (UPF0127 family)